jgi:hypothetical protein
MKPTRSRRRGSLQVRTSLPRTKGAMLCDSDGTNTALFTDLAIAAGGVRHHAYRGPLSRAYVELTIHIIHGDTGNYAHRRKCGNCLTVRLSSRTESAPFAGWRLPTTATLFRTTGRRKEWAEHGETIIRTIFRPFIGGVMRKKAQHRAAKTVFRTSHP